MNLTNSPSGSAADISNSLAPIAPGVVDLFQVSIGKGASKEAIYWFTLTDRDLARRVFEVLSGGLPGYVLQIAEVDAPPLPSKTIDQIERMQERIRELLLSALLDSPKPARVFLLLFASYYANRGLAPVHAVALRAIAHDLPRDDEVYIPFGNASGAAALSGGGQ